LLRILAAGALSVARASTFLIDSYETCLYQVTTRKTSKTRRRFQAALKSLCIWNASCVFSCMCSVLGLLHGTLPPLSHPLLEPPPPHPSVHGLQTAVRAKDCCLQAVHSRSRVVLLPVCPVVSDIRGGCCVITPTAADSGAMPHAPKRVSHEHDRPVLFASDDPGSTPQQRRFDTELGGALLVLLLCHTLGVGGHLVAACNQISLTRSNTDASSPSSHARSSRGV
jgi:hypothetical protein